MSEQILSADRVRIVAGPASQEDAIREAGGILLESPVDWGGEEVRFVVGIAGLENEHLEMLSSIAILFSDEDEVAKLLAAPDEAALFALLGDVNA